MLKDCVSTFVNSSKFIINYKKKIDEVIENRITAIKESWGHIIYASGILHPHKYYSRFLSLEKKTKEFD